MPSRVARSAERISEFFVFGDLALSSPSPHRSSSAASPSLACSLPHRLCRSLSPHRRPHCFIAWSPLASPSPAPPVSVSVAPVVPVVRRHEHHQQEDADHHQAVPAGADGPALRRQHVEAAQARHPRDPQEERLGLELRRVVSVGCHPTPRHALSCSLPSYAGEC